jgi:ankyrin repeat protein
VKKGANPNICDSLGHSPFLMAVNWSNLEIARFLYSVGANPN